MKKSIPTLQNKYTGIDGCPAGWFAVTLLPDHSWELQIFSSFRSLAETLNDSSTYFIDMPIGLSERNLIRDVEYEARNELRPYRHSSVFSPPCRMALRQPDYEKAKQKNLQVEGKRISIQSWNIAAKINEVDSVLRRRPAFRSRCHESHPEICFKYLNDGQALAISKKRAEGLELRIELISNQFEGAWELYQTALDSYPRKELRKDDIADAMCLAVTAMRCEQNGYSWVKGSHEKDVRGIPMRMAYFNPAV